MKGAAKHKVFQAPRGHKPGQGPAPDTKPRLAWEGEWETNFLGVRGPRGAACTAPTHLRFRGRTLTATLTDAIAHPGPARAGTHLLSSPRAPATLATPAAAPAHFPVGPRPSVPGRTWRPAAAPPARPLSMPRAAPPRVIRLGLGGGPEARRGGTRLPGRRRRRSGNREDPAEGRGRGSPRAARAEGFQEHWNPNLIPWKTGEKEVVAVI